MAVALQNPVPQSSVELAQTAKGATQAAVKVYDIDPEVALRKAQDIYDRLVAKYSAVPAGAPQ